MAISSLRSPLSSALSSLRSSSSSAFSVSACEWTDTYSPAAIDIAPATRPATPATNTLLWVACEAATPSIRLDVESMPSFAPNTAARSQPMRPVRCRSLLPTGILEASLIWQPLETARRTVVRAPVLGMPAGRVKRNPTAAYAALEDIAPWMLANSAVAGNSVLDPLLSQQPHFDGLRKAHVA